MKSDLWRWAAPDGQQRKLGFEELRTALANGQVPATTLVWRAGWTVWRRASEVPELNGPAIDIPPPPMEMMAVLRQYEGAPGAAPPPEVEEVPPPLPSDMALEPTQASKPLKTQIGGSAYGLVANPGPVTPRAGDGPPRPAGGALPTILGTPAISAPPRSVPPPVPPRSTPPGDVRDKASSFLDSDALIEVNRGDDGGSPPTDPILHDVVTDATVDTDVAGLPRGPTISLIAADIAAIRQGRPPKNKLLMGVLGSLGLCVVILLIAGVVSLFSGSSKSDKTAELAASSSASASARTASAAISAKPADAPSPNVVPPPVAKTATTFEDCTAAGDSTLIAPRAMVASALEAHLLESGPALAFASSARDAVAMSLDASSLAKTKTIHTKAVADIRRVTPTLVNGKLAAIADVDRKGDHLQTRRVVPTKTLIDIGVADGKLVTTPHGRDTVTEVAPLTSEDRVEALRAAVAGEDAFALTFRQGNAIFLGPGSSKKPDEPLSKIVGLGQVGSPAIAVNGERVLLAWADRSEGSDWKIRLAKAPFGGPPQEPTVFAVPAGGLGGNAMSPSLAKLPGGRFLLAWTEGVTSNHQVRAITIDENGQPSGSPITISSAGINAGQPAALVGEGGRGFVAFLASKGKTFEVYATPVNCPSH